LHFNGCFETRNFVCKELRAESMPTKVCRIRPIFKKFSFLYPSRITSCALPLYVKFYETRHFSNFASWQFSLMHAEHRRVSPEVERIHTFYLYETLTLKTVILFRRKMFIFNAPQMFLKILRYTSTHHRSAYNFIYSIWYLSHRYCYLPLSWKSWNQFECAVGG
jgi:hypothetical protein